MVGSLSTVHEAVEAIKTGLKGQEEGTVKVSQLTTCFGEVTNLAKNCAEQKYTGIPARFFCGRMDLSTAFNKFESRTGFIYFRSDFDADFQTLVIYMASGIHQSAESNFYHVFNDAMKSQGEMYEDELDWVINTFPCRGQPTTIRCSLASYSHYFHSNATLVLFPKSIIISLSQLASFAFLLSGNSTPLAPIPSDSGISVLVGVENAHIVLHIVGPRYVIAVNLVRTPS